LNSRLVPYESVAVTRSHMTFHIFRMIIIFFFVWFAIFIFNNSYFLFIKLTSDVIIEVERHFIYVYKTILKLHCLYFKNICSDLMDLKTIKSKHLWKNCILIKNFLCLIHLLCVHFNIVFEKVSSSVIIINMLCIKRF